MQSPGDIKVYIPMSADIVHAGHMNVIKEGSRLGRVTVGLLTDEAVAAKKRLTFMTYQQRYDVISNIKGVDSVVPQATPDYRPNLHELKPDYFLHGDDWRPEIKKQVSETMATWGGKVVEIKYSEGISSTFIQKRLKSRGIPPAYRLGLLKRLLYSKQTARALEAHDGLSALVAENAAHTDAKGNKQVFDVIWVSSLTGSLAHGKHDIEIIDRSTKLGTISDILDVTTRPLIVDADTGGQVAHFAHLVHKLEEIGVSAVVIEDKTGQKRNSLYGTPDDHTQEDIGSFATKIRAGTNARISEDFFIIARIESLILGKGIKDALKRASAYIEAGADAIVIHSKKSDGKDVERFASGYNQLPDRKPLIFIPTSYPKKTEAELTDWGANLIIYANHLLRAAYPAMQRAAKDILISGHAYGTNEYTISMEDLLGILPNE